MRKIQKILILLMIFLSQKILADEIIKDFEVKKLEKIKIDNANGNLKVVTGDVKKATIKITSDKLLKNCNFNFDNEKEEELKFEIGKGTKSPCKADIELSIPKNLELKVNNGSGDIEISNLDKEIEIHAGSGDINLADIADEVEIKLGSGMVKAKNIRGKLEASIGAGNFEAAEMSNSSKIKLGGGNINVNYKDFSKNDDLKIDYSIGAGNISLKLPANKKVKLGSYKIRKIMDDKTNGLITFVENNEDAKLYLKKGSGNITLISE